MSFLEVDSVPSPRCRREVLAGGSEGLVVEVVGHEGQRLGPRVEPVRSEEGGARVGGLQPRGRSNAGV